MEDTNSPVQVTLPPGMTPEQFTKMMEKMTKTQPEGDDVVFKAIPETELQELRVVRSVYKGRELLALRRYWRKDSSEELQPGKGATFTYEEIDEIIEGLQKMKTWCEEQS